MKSWITTVFGVFAGVSTVVAHGVHDVPSLIAAACMAFLGLSAKDSTK